MVVGPTLIPGLETPTGRRGGSRKQPLSAGGHMLAYPLQDGFQGRPKLDK